MTDRTGQLLDPAEQALRIQQTEHAHELLAQRVTSGMENVQNSIGDVNSSLRRLDSKVDDLTKLQHSHDANRDAIKRIEDSVDGLRTTMEQWFETFDERNREKWEAHELKNETTKEQLESKIIEVRERTSTIRTIGAVIALLGGSIVGGFLWTINNRFNDNRSVINQNAADIYDMKLYLARGGRVPAEPYVPPRQRSKRDEQPESEPAEPAGKP